MENLSRVFQKQKSKKTHEKNELYNSIEDWILLTFSGCRKVLGKMPGYIYYFVD